MTVKHDDVGFTVVVAARDAIAGGALQTAGDRYVMVSIEPDGWDCIGRRSSSVDEEISSELPFLLESICVCAGIEIAAGALAVHLEALKNSQSAIVFRNGEPVEKYLTLRSQDGPKPAPETWAINRGLRAIGVPAGDDGKECTTVGLIPPWPAS